MQENTETTRDRQLDEELSDVLIAISVVAKRLARKLQEGGEPHEDERDGTDHRGVAYCCRCYF